MIAIPKTSVEMAAKQSQSLRYMVDIPDPNWVDDNSPYINVGSFDSSEKAQEFLLARYGMPADVAAFFISEI